MDIRQGRGDGVLAVMALRILGAAVWVLALLVVPGVAWAAPVTVTPIFHGTETASGQTIVLPGGPVQVTVSRYEIAPGAALAVHRHKYPRYAYVVSGTLQVTNVETGAARIYHAGDFAVEMVGIWHKGANIGSDPVVLIVTDQAPVGVVNTELRAGG